MERAEKRLAEMWFETRITPGVSKAYVLHLRDEIGLDSGS